MTYFTADYLYAQGQLLEEHYLLVEEGVVQHIAPLRQLQPRAFRDMVAFEDAVIMPGLVNAHTHSSHSLLKGTVGLQHALTPEYVAMAARFAFCQLLRQGVTTVCDFLEVPDPDNRLALEIVQAAQAVGIRLALVKALPGQTSSTAGLEQWMTGLDQLAATAVDKPDLLTLHAGIDKWHPTLLKDSFALAQQWSADRHRRYHYHLTPTHLEREACFADFNTSAVCALDQLGVLDANGVGHHATWLDDEEMTLLSQAGAGLVMTPSTSLSYGEGCPRLVDALTSNIPIALGTGGWVRNNRGSILDEIRLVTLFQMSAFQRQAVLRPQQMLGLATEAAGTVLGLPVGSLAPQEKADFVVLDLNDWSLQPHNKLIHHLAFSIASTAINAVFVGGKRLVDTGELLSVDEQAIMQTIRQTVEQLG
jgi:5-methylthioadenosine/S-adenosylhomocysteine deaminase